MNDAALSASAPALCLTHEDTSSGPRYRQRMHNGSKADQDALEMQTQEVTQMHLATK